ncbi:DUF499 domain-containing protein [Demequina rhizosphaerae]|uniref:DUF499 domain-containing protein n=1 Tax=Demequina rhizosphaerae TaxID=1638985 RepID=UPI0007858F0E|nr:Swt1 family HEPN domain-containing protein [Demequina rhizosphaerae]
MALNNRDRISKAIEYLAAGLEPYVDTHMSASANGKDWIQLLEARDNQRHGGNRSYSKNDLQVQLRCLTEEWRAFDGLGRAEQNFASELREVRNKWAHNDQFNGDDTVRALDTAERLLTAVGAPEPASAVNKLRVDLQRTIYDDQARHRAKTAVKAVSTPGEGVKAWRDVIEPHDDVARGNFHAAEFAADLHSVAVSGNSTDEYADPAEFFARTYVTEGLGDLIGRASRRLSGDTNASPVVNLQTNFGGGKTHSMLALWHLFSGLSRETLPQAVQDAVGDVEVGEIDAKRVALVGTAIGPNEPRIKDDGTEVRTLWGELAWQLGGRDAYDMIANSDRTSTPPGDALTALISQHSPALIMIDEWVAYARNLNDDDSLCGGRFEAQFTFAQQLTEAVSATPSAMLVISIPASDAIESPDAANQIEIGGARGRQALESLQNVVGRKADHWRPANSLESFEIVKRRLFKAPDADARRDIGAVAKQFVGFYQDNAGTFPREASDMKYAERIEAAYPIHPELFDRLYSDWSTLERFQRTRGVLRLMSSVIHELWKAGDASPLIMPGSVPLHMASVSGELTNYLPDSWKPIIDQDIDGENAIPVQIDTEKTAFGQRSLTRRIARTVFMGAAPTLSSEHRGIERPRLWLGVAIPGDTVGNFGSALEVLGQRATYLYSDSGRYWFDTTPSIGRTASDIADKLREQPETVWEELSRRLRDLSRDRGDFAAIHAAPASSGEVPDTDSARLVIVPPRHLHTKGRSDSGAMTFAEDVLKRHGAGARTHANMIVFAAFDAGRYVDDLEPAVRQYLAWHSIHSRADDLNLKASDKTRAARQVANEDQTVTARLRDALRWMLTPVQEPGDPVEVIAENVSGSTGSIGAEFSSKLRTSDRLSSQYSPTRIRLALDGALSPVWSAGHVSTGDLWRYYTQYPYCDRLANRRVFDDAVMAVMDGLAFEQDGFALAESYDEAAARYAGLRIPGPDASVTHLTDSWLLVKPDIALAQAAADAKDVAAEDDGDDGDDGDASTGDDGARVVRRPRDRGAERPRVPNARFESAIDLSPQRDLRAQLESIMNEVLVHLQGASPDVFEVRLEVSAERAEGFSVDVARTVSENARTLGFAPGRFEER